MDELVEVGRYPSQAQADQRALVLAAVGINCRIEPFGAAVALLVPFDESGRARRELATFEHENTPRGPVVRPTKLDIWGIEAALAYVAVMLFVFGADSKGLFALHWQGLGAANAGMIMDGDWWRTVTALTLHTGSVHLFGNLAAGIIFGYLLSHTLGAGVAWLAITLAGALGNVLNAAVQPDVHTAIGASTAVFGALGLLAGTALKGRAAMRWQGGLRRWTPIAAGLMLLAFFGMGGEQTDIWAHAFGFLVGGVMGFALAHLGFGLLRRRALQGICAASTLGLIMVAWALALGFRALY